MRFVQFTFSAILSANAVAASIAVTCAGGVANDVSISGVTACDNNSPAVSNTYFTLIPDETGTITSYAACVASCLALPNCAAGSFIPGLIGVLPNACNLYNGALTGTITSNLATANGNTVFFVNKALGIVASSSSTTTTTTTTTTTGTTGTTTTTTGTTTT